MEYPVFFDKTGRRWKAEKAILLFAVTIIVAVTMLLLPTILSPLPLPPTAFTSTSEPTDIKPLQTPPQASSLFSSLAASPATPLATMSATTIVDAMRSANTPVVGSGPLMRIIEVVKKDTNTAAYDPFTKQMLHPISVTDAAYIGNDKYVLERYGEKKGRRLALTYDDGPNATYTPQLLDLLSREGVRASFFMVGSAVVQHKQIAQRVVREGHAVGNHTFSHRNFEYLDSFTAAQEVNQAGRIIAATTGRVTPFFRIPYGGDTDESFRENLTTLAYAQQMGYTITSYHFDSSDWQFSSGKKPIMPKFDGNDLVVLLHDSGGDRSATLAYTEQLIHTARQHGYSFANIDDLYAPPATAATTPVSPENSVALASTEAALVWPKYLIWVLFGFTIVMMLLTTVLNIVLATINRARSKKRRFDRKYKPSVAVIVPAYNEGKVIVSSVRSLLHSRYRKMRVVIIDDGSTDDTWKFAQRLARRYKRVTAIHQPNGGKSSALNNAISRTPAEIVICVDADTIFPDYTVSNLVRHFQDESVAAVAGVIKVGNVKSMLTRWQALEYATSISIDRNAQSLLGSIMIVPGACGAWRRSVVREVGGFSHTTLAEDCDLTLKIQRTGRYRVVQDNEAVSYTEAPEDIASFAKQRFRWMFGNIQALWKQREMIDNPAYGWLGCFTMPISVITVTTPILFWPLLIILTYQNILMGNILIILYYFIASLVLQVIVSAIGLALAKERPGLLWAAPYARLVYSPIRTYLLYKTLITIAKGNYVGWNKLIRTGSVTLSSLPSGRARAA